MSAGVARELHPDRVRNVTADGATFSLMAAPQPSGEVQVAVGCNGFPQASIFLDPAQARHFAEILTQLASD